MRGSLSILVFAVLHTSSAIFTCSCTDAPTGKGCGDIGLTQCDGNTCDGECLDTVQSLNFLDLKKMNEEPPMRSKDTTANGIRSPFSLTSVQSQEMTRMDALAAATANLVTAEKNPTKSHGVRPNGNMPSNIHATLIYATNNACLKNVTDCDWFEYPIMNYGGDLPMAPKSSTSTGEIQFLVSCIVCSDAAMCTRPEFNVHMITKHVINQQKKTREEEVDVAKEIGEIEKRCKRTRVPFDQTLIHLRNQHPGLFQMYGLPPPVVSAPSEKNEDNLGPSLEMLRSQRR